FLLLQCGFGEPALPVLRLGVDRRLVGAADVLRRLAAAAGGGPAGGDPGAAEPLGELLLEVLDLLLDTDDVAVVVQVDVVDVDELHDLAEVLAGPAGAGERGLGGGAGERPLVLHLRAGGGLLHLPLGELLPPLLEGLHAHGLAGAAGLLVLLGLGLGQGRFVVAVVEGGAGLGLAGARVDAVLLQPGAPPRRLLVGPAQPLPGLLPLRAGQDDRVLVVLALTAAVVVGVAAVAAGGGVVAAGVVAGGGVAAGVVAAVGVAGAAADDRQQCAVGVDVDQAASEARDAVELDVAQQFGGAGGVPAVIPRFSTVSPDTSCWSCSIMVRASCWVSRPTATAEDSSLR